MQNQTILIVEDEEDILDLLDFTLCSEGYDVIGSLDTTKVKKLLDEEDISLILMDRNLPNVEGSLFIQDLRNQGYNQPVIYISAKDKDEDIIEGFDRGGDDYITKPFKIPELKARVKAVLKRANKTQDILKYKDIIYNTQNKTFTISDKKIKLTHLEHDLLLEFIKNQDKLLSREYLLDTVWEDSYNLKPKTVNVAIKRLKEKIDPKEVKNYIKSIRGEGYIFA
jgi:DNA-binding response OmpR family regulator